MNSTGRNFVAIDVETANSDMASVCQIGVAKYENGKLIDEWSSLIDPEDWFSGINISIHGIEPEDVIGSPTIPDIIDSLRTFIGNDVCISHTFFDKSATRRMLNKYELPGLDVRWLDSSSVARRTWKDVERSGYGIANLCKKIGYEFEHHDALEDAKAAAQVFLAAVMKSDMGIEEWLARVAKPINPADSITLSQISKTANVDGDMFGEVIVFTGALEFPRREAAKLAAKVGCKIGSNVTKKTTLLVVGDQDIGRLAGESKSSKHRRAEELILNGQDIRILKESDFLAVVN